MGGAKSPESHLVKQRICHLERNNRAGGVQKSGVESGLSIDPSFHQYECFLIEIWVSLDNPEIVKNVAKANQLI